VWKGNSPFSILKMIASIAFAIILLKKFENKDDFFYITLCFNDIYAKEVDTDKSRVQRVD